MYQRKLDTSNSFNFWIKLYLSMGCSSAWTKIIFQLTFCRDFSFVTLYVLTGLHHFNVSMGKTNNILGRKEGIGGIKSENDCKNNDWLLDYWLKPSLQ